MNVPAATWLRPVRAAGDSFVQIIKYIRCTYSFAMQAKLVSRYSEHIPLHTNHTLSLVVSAEE